MVLDQQAGVKNLLEGPPHTLNVIGVHSPVSAVHVNPITHTGSEVCKCIHVAHNRFPAFGVKFGNAIIFNIFLSRKPEFLFNG